MSIWQSDNAQSLRAITELGVFLELDHADSRYGANHPYVVTSNLLSDTVEVVRIEGFYGHEYVSTNNGNSKGLFFADTNSIEYTDGYANIDGPFKYEPDPLSIEEFADGDQAIVALANASIAKNRGASFKAEFVRAGIEQTGPVTILRFTVVRPAADTATDSKVVISDSARQGYNMFASMASSQDLDEAIGSDVFGDTIETLYAGTPGIETLVAEIRALHAQTTGKTGAKPAGEPNAHVVWHNKTEWDVKVVTNTGLVSMFYDPLEQNVGDYTFTSTLLESADGKTVEEVRIGGVSVPADGIKVRDNEALFYVTPDPDAETEGEVGFIAVGNTPYATELGCLISSMAHMLECDEDLADDNLMVVEAHAYAHLGKNIHVEHISNSETPEPHTIVRVTVEGQAHGWSWSDYDGWDNAESIKAPHPATAQDIIDNNGPPRSAFDDPKGPQATKPAIKSIFDATADETDIMTAGMLSIAEGKTPDKAFTDVFGHVLGVRGSHIVLGDEGETPDFGDDEDDDSIYAPLSQDEIVAGLMAVASGKDPGQAFLDHAGLSESDLPKLDEADKAEVVQFGSNGMQDILDLAAKTGAQVVGVSPGSDMSITINADGSTTMSGAAPNPLAGVDLSFGLSEASTPDADNPNHEWRDGIKYVRGTSIAVKDPNDSPSPNKNKVASFWDAKDES